MREDKQIIEEMARDICENYNADGTCYCDNKPCDLKCECFTDAQYFYEKGYRKQSEGEWIDHIQFGFEGNYSGSIYECSNCSHEIYDADIEEYNFCPHCGAKMKGGGE